MNKLEKHIKEKLSERRINPSEGAWERVASNLSKPIKKNVRNGFWYYGIAASFVGLLALGIFYSPSNDGSPSVEVTTTIESRYPEPPIQKTGKTTEIVDSDSEVKKTGTPSIKPQIAERPSTPKTATDPLVMEDSPKLHQLVAEEVTSKEDAIIAKKLDAVMAKVSRMEADNVLVTNAEVDSLLRIAQREILTDRVLQQDGTVDAMALLEEVEGELDQTFRDQLFEKLKDGFFKVRTAVADRNN